MSRVTTPRLREFYPQLFTGAQPNVIALRGRILTVLGTNPNFNPNKAIDEKNELTKTEQVPMLADAIKKSMFLQLINDNPLTVKLKQGCSTNLPTGYLEGRKEKQYPIEGEFVFTDKMIMQEVTTKDLSSFFVEV